MSEKITPKSDIFSVILNREPVPNSQFQGYLGFAGMIEEDDSLSSVNFELLGMDLDYGLMPSDTTHTVNEFDINTGPVDISDLSPALREFIENFQLVFKDKCGVAVVFEEVIETLFVNSSGQLETIFNFSTTIEVTLEIIRKCLKQICKAKQLNLDSDSVEVRFY